MEVLAQASESKQSPIPAILNIETIIAHAFLLIDHAPMIFFQIGYPQSFAGNVSLFPKAYHNPPGRALFKVHG
jgi:hypothetical protein